MRRSQPSKVGRVNRSELDLNRPLAQFTGISPAVGALPADAQLWAADSRRERGVSAALAALAAKTARMVVGGASRSQSVMARWAGGARVPQPVAVVLPGETGLAVDHLNGASWQAAAHRPQPLHRIPRYE